VLADLVRSNLLLVPLDRRGHWYRYHHLFRDMLLAELGRLEPELIAVLRRRAAAWCLQNGLPEEALEYSIAARDVEEAARLVEELWLPTHRQGRTTTVERWCRWLEEHGGTEGHPLVAVWCASGAQDTGRPVEAERWADVVDRWQYGDPVRLDDPVTEAWAGVLRASLCRQGVEQMRADADEAARKFAAENLVRPAAKVQQGIARVVSGDLKGADELLQDAVSAAEEIGAHELLALTLCEQSLAAMARNQWNRADVLVKQAGAVLRGAGIEDNYLTPLIYAAQARLAAHRGDTQAARQQLVGAQRLRHLLTYALPCLAVQARIELTRVYLGFADLAGARTLMREIDDLLKRRPGLGTLVGEAEALRIQIVKARGSGVAGASALTAAELRLLPLLSTHLSFADIGAELFVSPNTAKTHAVSIYRKLGAGSRSQAVARARELGLLEG
jgi:LuxR family maltose regulon positive regulatory protein